MKLLTSVCQGMPGFNVFVHPMLAKINPSLLNPNRNTRPVIKTVTEEVVDLRKNTAVVTADELVLALKRLHNLIHAYGHPAFARRLLPPVIWSLWSLASWIGASEHCEKNYCSPARDLVRIYVRLHASPLETRSLIRNLLFMGNKNPAKLQWKFKPSNDGQQIFISKTQENGPTNPLSNTGALLDLEPKASLLANILDEASTGDEISILFLDLFKQWVDAGRKKSTCEIVIKQDQDQDPDPLTRLLETKVLQELIKKTPKKLIGHPDQILDLIKEILQEQGSLPESDGPVATALSLLSIVVTSEGFQKSKVDKNTMDSIITSLGHICQTNSDVAKTAGNLSYLLQHWRDIEAQLQPMPTANARELEDRKTYNLALQYITGPDAPAPVRSEGLNMISNLIAGRSPILDIPATMALLSSLLEDRDDFINLRVIKMFNQLATHHPSSTVQELLDHYMDAQEQVNVDSRLRFGEALTQVVERLGETFTEELSKKTCQVLLLIAGRRAKREKTEKRQQKEARLSEMKRKKEAEAWGGTPPDWNGDEDKDVTSAEKQRSKIIASIVGGWESKRGSEDIRIRASALSILGAGMETNLDGVGPDMVTATIDLAMDILTMEPEVEKGILRRSAVLAVMSFIRALDKAKKSRRRIGFDLTDESQASISRTLEYIAHNDNDGLVQQHSRDVIESLQAWKMATLIPELPQQTQKGIFTRLAGLTVNPTKRLTPSMNPGSRPLVEEVE